MTAKIIEQLTESVRDITAVRRLGRIKAVNGSSVVINGLNDVAGLGDDLTICARAGQLSATVTHLEEDNLRAMLQGAADGIALEDIVEKQPKPRFAPHPSWIGRVIDPDGRPLDGRSLLPGVGHCDVNASPLPAHARRPMGQRLETGLAVLNTLLPIVQGQRVGMFAGSGVGKSTLIADLARGLAADVVVIALVGERGREVRHFVSEILGPEGMARSIVVAATSDRSAKLRRRCATAATTVAEYFRDQGQQVLLLVDSVTRFCEAHREVAVVGGEPANLRGFPASTMSAIANLCERAGPGVEGSGDITAIYSVLVAGSDMEEPVADMLRGVLDGHIVLDRAIAEAGRFPAIDVLRSVSRALPDAADRVENALISEARKRLGTWDRAALMVQSGLYETGSDPQIDAAIACHEKLDAFMTIKDKRDGRAHFADLRRVLGSAEQSSQG